jgi:23S rRNA (guanosine2251-2'-O)-methyltransferase
MEFPEKDETIFGIRSILEALNAGRQIDKIFLQKGLSNDLSAQLKGQARIHQTPISFVPSVTIERMARGKNHQGAIATLSPIEFAPLSEILLQVVESGEVPLLVMLDQVTDVRNLGAIARTLEAMGGHALIVPVQGSARINAEAVKASAGALHHVPVCREPNLRDTLLMLKDSGIHIVACHESATLPINREDLSIPVCFVFGSESSGISTPLLKLSDSEVFIPLKGKIASLNVSVAAGMVLYEAMSQRN